MRYMVVIERSPNNFAAYVPDLPGCVATGRTLQLVQKRISSAIALHLKGMEEDGSPAPHPSAQAFMVAAPDSATSSRRAPVRRRRLAS